VRPVPVLAFKTTEPPWQKVVGPPAVTEAVGGVQGATAPQVMVELTQETLGITSANSSAYSQLPGVATSQRTEVFPVARTLKRRLNMVPFTVTGVKANQAALNCLRVVALKGALGDRLENSPQLLRNPALMAELRPVTELMHCNLVES